MNAAQAVVELEGAQGYLDEASAALMRAYARVQSESEGVEEALDEIRKALVTAIIDIEAATRHLADEHEPAPLVVLPGGAS